MSESVLQTLKKQCSPTMKKTFKERNPDIDMDEIQNNPNVPEDVKAAISGALLLSAEDDEEAEGSENDNEENGLPIVDDLETFDEDYIMDYADFSDKKPYKGRRKDVEDEDWLCKSHLPFDRYRIKFCYLFLFCFLLFSCSCTPNKKTKTRKSKEKEKQTQV